MSLDNVWPIEPIRLTASDLAFLEIQDATRAGCTPINDSEFPGFRMGSVRILKDQIKATQRPDGTWDTAYVFEFDPSA